MDTTTMECTRCYTETDCINGLCQECQLDRTPEQLLEILKKAEIEMKEKGLA